MYSLDEYLERQDSTDKGNFIKIDGGWFDSLCVYI